MIANKKLFSKGAIMMAGFFIVLFLMFMPLFHGHHAINAMDNLYNSISKGSTAGYIPKLMEESGKYKDKEIKVDLKLKTKEMATETMLLLTTAGAKVIQNEVTLSVEGNLDTILQSCLADSKLLFDNDGKTLKEKYNYGETYEEKRILYNWWNALKSTNKALTKQEHFVEAKFVGTVMTKAVECSFNYYKVQAENIKAKVSVVIFSLIFYVIYTVWYGFGLMYMFEGWGMKLSH